MPCTETKILLIVFVGLILAFLIYNGRAENFAEEHILAENNTVTNIPTNIDKQMQVTKNIASDAPIDNDSTRYFSPNDFAPPESEWLKGKFNSRNKARDGEYKKSSYSGAMRGSLGPSDWDEYFDSNNNVIGSGQGGSGDKFMPVDETNNGFAVFKTKGKAVCGSNQDCEPEDLFDVDKYLPQEVNDDWYEVMPEPVSIKNRHLVNITKPIGVNTIGSSKKNANYDLRAAPVNPKNIVSPWGNSSIDPDISIKPLF